MKSLFCRVAIALLVVSGFCTSSTLAQEKGGLVPTPNSQGENSQQSDLELTTSEYDQWQGSSLGIRIDTKENNLFVAKVMPHLEDGPLQVGDQLLQLGEIELSGSTLGEVGSLMKETPPGTEFAVRISRDEKEQTVTIKTFRQEFVDIASIVERIQKNRIIKSHLEELDRISELETITERMVDAVEKSSSPRLAYEGINRVIDEIGISHTALVPESTFLQLTSANGGEVGIALRRFRTSSGEGYFVIDIKPGSAAYKSKIQLGDRIEFINGVQIERSRRLVLAGEEQRYEVFGIDADKDEEVRFEFRQNPAGPLLTTTLTAGKTVGLRDSVSESARVIETSGLSIGYIRFWNLMSIDVNRELQSRLESTFSECDALILDIRGRGGILPSVLAIDRTIKKLEIPVIGITDELTRSAKELLSFRLKKHENVTMIGEKTSGAVTAATFAKLPSGNVLMFPVMSSDALKQYTDGVALEGVGVEPDESINFYEPFCRGRDHLLQEAIKRAVAASKTETP